jgi:hypothetical protein
MSQELNFNSNNQMREGGRLPPWLYGSCLSSIEKSILDLVLDCVLRSGYEFVFNLFHFSFVPVQSSGRLQ